MPRSVRLEELAEGGFVNDRSGKATAKLRARLRGQRVTNPKSAYERSRGNPALKRFRHAQ